MKRKINKDTIVDVKLYNFLSCKDQYSIVEEDKYERYFFNIFKYIVAKKGQLYDSFFNRYIDLNEKTHVVKDGIVYELPEVIITTADSKKTRFYFDKYESAEKFYNEVTSTENFIEVKS